MSITRVLRESDTVRIVILSTDVFASLLRLLMASTTNPPLVTIEDLNKLEAFADSEAKRLDYVDWVDAYHKLSGDRRLTYT